MSLGIPVNRSQSPVQPIKGQTARSQSPSNSNEVTRSTNAEQIRLTSKEVAAPSKRFTVDDYYKANVPQELTDLVPVLSWLFPSNEAFATREAFAKRSEKKVSLSQGPDSSLEYSEYSKSPLLEAVIGSLDKALTPWFKGSEAHQGVLHSSGASSNSRTVAGNLDSDSTVFGGAKKKITSGLESAYQYLQDAPQPEIVIWTH